MDEQPPFEPLSEREREILALLGENLTNREIAERLFLALPTVKWYNRQIYNKLGVENRHSAVKQARECGMLSQTIPVEAIPVKHNLPSQLTPFVDRSRELTEIDGLLAQPHIRLITILAAGGMGKTRLALEAAERAKSRYPDGVYFVPLAALASSDHIVPALAEALNLQFAPDGRTPEQQLTDFLRRKHLLLVLDNFEHLLDAAPLITTLLSAAPNVTALATSRERLNLNGETVYPLAGLHYPENGADAALRYSAAELFIACALRANPHFVADDERIGQVCRRVQGMPLAIELAAAWMRTLSVEEIDAEIARSADFLSTSMVNVPERQRSVRAVFDAAWARLDDDARRAFRRMSVFRGGCTREAAQAVTGASLQTLAALVDKALLWRNPHTSRYDIHELLRQYAEAELECSDEADAIRQAHQEYYAAHGAEWGAGMMLDQIEEGLALFDADIDNVRSAFARASAHAIPAELEPFADIWVYYDFRGKWREAIAEIETAIERLEPDDSIALAKFLCVHSDFLYRLRIFPGGLEHGKRAVDMIKRQGDHPYLPFAIAIWGNERMLMARDLVGASDIFHRGFELAQKNSQPVMITLLLNRLGWVSHRIGKHKEGLSYNTEAYRWAKQHRLLWYQGLSANSLAEMMLGAGRIDEAEPYFMEGMEIARKLSIPFALIEALRGLSKIAMMRGDLETRQRHNKTILQIQQHYNYPDDFLFESYLALADGSINGGDINEAQHYLRNAIAQVNEKSVEIGFKFWLVVTANFLIQLGEVAHACAFLIRAERLPDEVTLRSTSYIPAGDLLARCRAALSPEEFEAAWARGQTMTNEEAIALVAEAL